MSSPIEIDLSGFRCPIPIVELHRLLKKLDVGQQVSVVADDPAFCLDVETWCRKTGHQLISLKQDDHRLVALIEKAESDKKPV
jgi:tRNA 2-thiouridine synthesizing protein A